jgi:hypothetical protein
MAKFTNFATRPNSKAKIALESSTEASWLGIIQLLKRKTDTDNTNSVTEQSISLKLQLAGIIKSGALKV